MKMLVLYFNWQEWIDTDFTIRWSRDKFVLILNQFSDLPGMDHLLTEWLPITGAVGCDCGVFICCSNNQKIRLLFKWKQANWTDLTCQIQVYFLNAIIIHDIPHFYISIIPKTHQNCFIKMQNRFNMGLFRSYFVDRINCKVLRVNPEPSDALFADPMILDGLEEFCVLESWYLFFIEWLNEGLLNQNRSLLNQIVLFLEQFFVFIARKGKLLKRSNQKLGNYQISIFIIERLAWFLKILFNPFIVGGKLIDFYLYYSINLLFTFADKLCEDINDSVEVLFFLSVSSPAIFLQNRIKRMEYLIVIV